MIGSATKNEKRETTMSEDTYYNPTTFTKIAIFYMNMAMENPTWDEDKITKKTRSWAYKHYGFEATSIIHAIFYPKRFAPEYITSMHKIYYINANK